MIRLSNRQLRAIDRRHGAYLVLPWPENRPIPDDGLGIDEERPASQSERAAAMRLVGPLCAAYGLIHLATMAGRLRQPIMGAPPEQRPVHYHLLAHLVTARWQRVSRPGAAAPALWGSER